MKQHKFNAVQFETNIAALPELCFAKSLMDDSLIVLKRGEQGFYPADPHKYPLAPNQTRDDQVGLLNDQMRVSTAQRMAMEMGSIAGFDVPGADPEVHKARALVEDMETINPELGGVGRQMLRSGASYGEIKDRYKRAIGVVAAERGEKV